MLKWIVLCALILSPMAMAQDGWLTSYADATKESKKTGKPILMDFTGSNWCGWCIKLKTEVFNTPEFKAWAAKKVVLLELDFPQGVEQPAELKKQNKELSQKYNIEGFPTIIFADATGKELGKYGYDEGGPAVWTKKADEFLKKK